MRPSHTLQTDHQSVYASRVVRSGRGLGTDGVIPWPKVPRLNNDEMRGLTIDVVNRTYRFIHTLFDEHTGGELLLRLAQRGRTGRAVLFIIIVCSRNE